MLLACDTPPVDTAPMEPERSPAKPSATAPATTRMNELAELQASLIKSIPKDSADYSGMLALVMLHKRGSIGWDELTDRVAGQRLVPHPRGDEHLMRKSPGAKMPSDWQATWGEVAMTYWLGELSQAQYERLHHAAHPQCAKK